jgi:TolA-binding protein
MLEVLGRSYKQQAKFDDARAAFERVLADPFAAKTETAAKSQFLIGETWFLQQNWVKASLAYQRVYSIYKFPEWQAASLLMSGRCDENQNDPKAALESYKLIISEFPTASVADEAKTRLDAVQKKIGN